MNKGMDNLTAGIIGALVLALFATVLWLGMRIDDDLENFELPRCQKDSVLVGVGNFEYGYWDSYECGPAADDFAPFSDTQLQACGEAWYHTTAALDEALVRLGNDTLD